MGVIEVDRALPNVSGIRLSLACIARSLRPNSPMRETTLWNRTIELGGTDIQIDDRSTMVSFSIALPSPDFKPERSSLLGNIIWRLRAQPLPTTHPNFRYEFLLPAVRTARATFSDHG